MLAIMHFCAAQWSAVPLEWAINPASPQLMGYIRYGQFHLSRKVLIL